MTFPHIEPEFKLKKDSNVPDHLTPEHIKLVQDVNNAVMEAWLNCPSKDTDCLECGNDDCFKAFKKQAKLWDMSFEEYIRSHKEQAEKGKKAAEEQTARYAKYYADYNFKLIDGYFDKDYKNKKKQSTTNGLFND